MLRDDQVRRYSRHILLPDIGGTGQRRLLEARVAVSLPERHAGAALAAIAYLAAAGVGTLALGGFVDTPVTHADVCDGILFGVADLDNPRLTAIDARVAALNPDVRIVRAAPDDVPLAIADAGDRVELDVAGALIRGGAAAARAIAAVARRAAR